MMQAAYRDWAAMNTSQAAAQAHSRSAAIRSGERWMDMVVFDYCWDNFTLDILTTDNFWTRNITIKYHYTIHIGHY